MSTRVLPLPSIPPGSVLVKAIHVRGFGLTVQESYYNHWFTATPPSIPTFNITTAVFDVASTWFRNFYSGQLPSDMGECNFNIFANVKGHVQSSIAALTPIPPLAGDCISPMLKVRFRRSCDFFTPPIVGRCSFLPVIRAYLTGDYVNSTGKGFYDACLTQYMQTWSSQGALFTPAIYSQKMGVVAQLTTVNVLKQPGMDRKSRFKDAAHCYIYRWPFTP
jgi:hypothetical protein